MYLIEILIFSPDFLNVNILKTPPNTTTVYWIREFVFNLLEGSGTPVLYIGRTVFKGLIS